MSQTNLNISGQSSQLSVKIITNQKGGQGNVDSEDAAIVEPIEMAIEGDDNYMYFEDSRIQLRNTTSRGSTKLQSQKTMGDRLLKSREDQGTLAYDYYAGPKSKKFANPDDMLPADHLVNASFGYNYLLMIVVFYSLLVVCEFECTQSCPRLITRPMESLD